MCNMNLKRLRNVNYMNWMSYVGCNNNKAKLF